MFCDYIERLHFGVEMLRPQLYNWSRNREESVPFTNFPKMQSFFRNGFLEYPENTGLEKITQLFAS